MNESEEWNKFLQTITRIEKSREFDRKVDRLKKSSSATTFWAVFGGILGIYGLSHFYLNRPLEGIIIMIAGTIPSLFVTVVFSFLILSNLIPFLDFYPFLNVFDLGLKEFTVYIIFGIIRIGFFVGNIASARYQYSRYDFYIHWKAKKPWNNWGLESQF